ncbi:hypothetical protein P7C73_g236, partial [Tremellales sp. Uapishka_1]
MTKAIASAQVEDGEDELSERQGTESEEEGIPPDRVDPAVSGIRKSPPPAGVKTVVSPLTSGVEFPWTDVKFCVPTWLGATLCTHLIKRITKAGGIVTKNVSGASYILVNTHPSYKTEVTLLKRLSTVKSTATTIVPYHWLSRCYFTRKVMNYPRDPPIFVDEESHALQIAVGSMPGRNERNHLMTLLESNGAIVVTDTDCKVCIVPSNHPYLRHPPKGGKWENVVWKDPLWVRNAVLSQNGRYWQQKKESVRASRTRTEFSEEDRDWLARWLAFKRPVVKGRLSRSLYAQLEDNSSDEWMRRHSAAAWHEHFKRTRDKVGRDGKILEAEVDRYVKAGIDETLQTREERAKEGTPSEVRDQSEVQSDSAEEGEVEPAIAHEEDPGKGDESLEVEGMIEIAEADDSQGNDSANPPSTRRNKRSNQKAEAPCTKRQKGLRIQPTRASTRIKG